MIHASGSNAQPKSFLMNTKIIRGIRFIGHMFLNMLASVGRSIMFTLKALLSIFTPPFYLREIITQAIQIGWFSLPIVAFTTLFTGAALALQIYSGGERFNAESAVPTIVAIGILREIGPVLAGLMLAARVTSSIAAELGTMKVTEQIDALFTLSTDPMKYLVAPRLIAATLSMPVLVAIGDTIGIMGGWLTGIFRLDFNSATYLINTFSLIESSDVFSGLFKSAVFGFIIAITGCYYGMNSNRGAQGVGQATKTSVVSASILILASNYVLTEVFFTHD